MSQNSQMSPKDRSECQSHAIILSYLISEVLTINYELNISFR